MINYQEEIKHFKPSLDVDNIEDAIAGMNLTDMNDLMMQLVSRAVEDAKASAEAAEPVPAEATFDDYSDGIVNEG